MGDTESTKQLAALIAKQNTRITVIENRLDQVLTLIEKLVSKLGIKN